MRRVLKTGGTFLLVADIYEKPGLPREVKDNIRKFHLFNPTREQFKNLFREAGFAETRIHTKDGEDWICVEEPNNRVRTERRKRYEAEYHCAGL